MGTSSEGRVVGGGLLQYGRGGAGDQMGRGNDRVALRVWVITVVGILSKKTCSRGGGKGWAIFPQRELPTAVREDFE